MRRLLATVVLLSGAAGALAAPTVSMVSPTNGNLYLAPASFAVRANASTQSPATLVRVEFYANGELIQTDTASPYQFDWTGVAAGAYSITAKAVDSTGGTGAWLSFGTTYVLLRWQFFLDKKR